MMQRATAIGCALATALVLGACATSNPDVISREDAQRMSQIQDGVVVSVRNVVVDGSQSGIGAVVGGITGAVAGYSVSSVQRESQVAGLLAGVAGAAAGNAIERMATREEAVEIVVRLGNGEQRAIVQAKGNESFAAGDRVRIVTNGGKVRVAKAPQ